MVAAGLRAHVGDARRGDGRGRRSRERFDGGGAGEAEGAFSVAATRVRHSAARGWDSSIVERIARLHGGGLQFHARDGGGLEVWVVLPLKRRDDVTA